VVNSLQERSGICVWKVLQTSLQYPTSKGVGAKVEDMSRKEWKKCEALRFYDFHKLLDDLDECHHNENLEIEHIGISQT